MARIKNRDTKPEMLLRRALWRSGIRYRVAAVTPAGRADIVVKTPRLLAVFIDGCFWHGCPQHYVRPRSRQDFWRAKLAENVSRDQRQTLALEEKGWRVIRIWEHSVHEELPDVVERIRQALSAASLSAEPDWRVTFVECIDEHRRIERRVLTSLRDPLASREMTGRRITAKWRRPRGA
jgi:DNA mismatch endonuclease, patch repair protein